METGHSRSVEKCFVLFGSNMGDKESIFSQTCLLINNRCGQVVKVSAAYESEPWGFEAKEWFLNRIIVVETELSPMDLLQQLLDIEKDLGRVRHPEIQGYTSRIADLDLLYYGNRIIQTETLTVPHPRLHLRRFTLVPLCDVDPDFIHPIFKMTQKELLEQCTDDDVVREIVSDENKVK